MAAVLFIGFLVWPMLFTSSGLGGDWPNHLWELQQQGLTIRHAYLPSLFVNTDSVFVPLFAYYGGTLFAVGGGLSIILGGAVNAYILLFLFGLGAAFGGWYWLARLAGVNHWLAHVPGLVFIASGYYLTLIYGRGDWPEFMAVSMIPLMVASGLRLLTAPRLTALPAIALATTTVLFFGSHNITLLWGTTLLALLSGVVCLAIPQARRKITRAGAVRTAAVFVPAALVNAWYIFPSLAYGFRTATANGNGRGLGYSLATSQHFVSASHLFTFSHAWASDSGFVMALPVLAIVWVVVAILVSVRGSPDSSVRRLLLIIAGLTVLVGYAMTHVQILGDLPRPYRTLQFSYRLDTFVTLGVVGAMVAALAVPWSSTRIRRIGVATLAVVVIASVAGAVEQVDTHPSVLSDRESVVTTNRPLSYYAQALPYWYDDRTLPVVGSLSLPAVVVPAKLIQRDHVAISVRVPPGTGLLSTNLAGAPYLLAISGARVAGRDQGDNLVLRLPANGSSRRVISVRAADTLPVALGRAVTIAALLFWAIVALARLLRGGWNYGSCALTGAAVLPIALLAVALLLSGKGTTAPTSVSLAAQPVRLPALEACWRRRGFTPNVALRVPASGYDRVEVPLGGGGDAVVFVFASPLAATERGGGLIKLGGVRRGRTVVLFSHVNQGLVQHEASRLEGCV